MDELVQARDRSRARRDRIASATTTAALAATPLSLSSAVTDDPLGSSVTTDDHASTTVGPTSSRPASVHSGTGSVDDPIDVDGPDSDSRGSLAPPSLSPSGSVSPPPAPPRSRSRSRSPAAASATDYELLLLLADLLGPAKPRNAKKEDVEKCGEWVWRAEREGGETWVEEVGEEEKESGRGAKEEQEENDMHVDEQD
ncbi:hypothetical protein HDU93_007810, partial [Gonapodya sp. JEL0774]